MATARDHFDKRLKRAQRWTDRVGRMLDREMTALEDLYRKAIADLEAEKQAAIQNFKAREEEIRALVETSGREFQLEKYRHEKDAAKAKADSELLDGEAIQIERKAAAEIQRLTDERLSFQVSWERQKSALSELYQEKRRHLIVQRGALLKEVQNAEQKLKKAKEKAEAELNSINEKGTQTTGALSTQAESKRQGWFVARETMQRELDVLNRDRDGLARRVDELRSEKEKELENARQAMLLAKQQLDIDKATLVERAEEDQRKLDVEVKELQERLIVAEKEFQDFVAAHEKRKAAAEDAYAREETLLKEAVKTEADKRDYEQKLFEQEKIQRERELTHLREELEKRTWHWDNQIRALLLQKSVQDSEHDAERMRVDREARVSLRALEARRDEIRQRLNDIKARHAAIEANAQKELDVVTQRWQFRRERLWSVWQARLDALKKERETLKAQIDALLDNFNKEKRQATETEAARGGRRQELETFLSSAGESRRAERKQREIQFELEKTRVLAQIKECETLIGEWSDRLKVTQDEVAKKNSGLVAELGFVDRWYREEEKETEAFLGTIREAIAALESVLVRFGIRDAA